MISIEQLNDEGLLDSEAIVLEPRHVFDKAIVGVSNDGNHIIYDFDLSVESIKDGSNITNDDATEYLEYNTIRALDYMPSEFRPII